MPTGISTWYWNPARSTLARCSGPVYAVRAAAGVAPPRSGGSARTCPIPHDKPLRRSRTTERPEQRPDPRRERPRRDSQAHHQERLRHASASGPAGSLPRVPGAPRVRAGPSHRHARRAAGDRGPWVSLPLRATIPEGNTVGQQRRRRPIASRAGAEGAGADRGHRRIDAGDIDAGETWGTSTSAHRIEGEADPLLVVTDGAPGLIAGADPRRNGDDYPMTSLSDGLGPQKDPNSGRTRVESGPAGTHRPTTRRGSGIAQPPAGSLPRVPGAPRVRAGPSHRHARRAAGDRGPWVSLPLRATIPEGNTVGKQRRRRPIASRAGAEAPGGPAMFVVFRS